MAATWPTRHRFLVALTTYIVCPYNLSKEATTMTFDCKFEGGGSQCLGSKMPLRILPLCRRPVA